MSNFNNLAFLLFVLTAMFPTVHSISNWCYSRDLSQHCEGNCFIGKCSEGGTVTGCDYLFPKEAVEQILEEICSENGVTYQSGSVKFCNCDYCNGEKIFKCETSGRSAEDILCYHDRYDTLLKPCKGNCVYAECTNGIVEVKGCAGKIPYNEIANKMEDVCQGYGISYQEGSLKYCNCDRCNGNEFTCEISGTGVYFAHGLLILLGLVTSFCLFVGSRWH